MIVKKTVCFSNLCQLHTRQKQLVIKKEDQQDKTIPIEDIGFLILDHYGITISHTTLAVMLENNVAVITTDSTHMPVGLFLPLSGNTVQGERFREQIKASVPLKKQAWKQIVTSKVTNQSKTLENFGLQNNVIKRLITKILSGDTSNVEAQAAKIYWTILFDPINFKRYRYGKPPNNLLNYGYAILRAVVARALVGTGLLPSLGIHHHNRYNAYPLADDVMEPYRPFVDEIVWNIAMNEYDISDITTELKMELLSIPNLPVKLEGETVSLMSAVSRTTASLYQFLSHKTKKLVLPTCG